MQDVWSRLDCRLGSGRSANGLPTPDRAKPEGDQSLRYYETVLIARQDISAAQVEQIVEDFIKRIEDGGGTVAKTEFWGLKSLAYRIKKNRKGHYVMLQLETPHDALLEAERNLRLNEDILRFMSIRIDALEDGPSIMASGRKERRDRRDDDRPRERRDNDSRETDSKESDREAA